MAGCGWFRWLAAGFVGGGWFDGLMPRKRERDAPPAVHRTARCGLRVTRAQRSRLFGLLRSAGDVWCAVLELNRWRRSRRDAPLAGYQELCRELAASGPGTFGELDSAGAGSVLRRYSDAWFAAAARRRAGDASARYPRRRRGLVPVRWHAGTFTLDGRALRLPAARGRPPLLVRLDRDAPYPAGAGPVGDPRVRRRAPVPGRDRRGPRRGLPAGHWARPCPGRGRGPGRDPPVRRRRPAGDQRLLVSGRAIRAECRQHLRDRKGPLPRRRPPRPRPGRRGSRRWRRHKRRQRTAEARHLRRVRQAQHEAAKTVVSWAVEHRVGTLAVGDPRGVLNLRGGTASHQRTRDWRIGHLIGA